ncbi:MAG: hypothetical protein ACYTAF_09335, partial [Planctomycetota bacterium]
WGTQDGITLYNLAALRERPEKQWTAGPRTSGVFILRYMTLYYEIRKRLSDGKGLRRTHDALAKWTKSLREAPARHIQLIADGVASIGQCNECKDGKMSCPQCGGSGIWDMPCTHCGGDGRLERARSKQDQAYFQCKKCLGSGIRKHATGCTRCGKTGEAKCGGCKGSGWTKELSGSPSHGSIWSEETCGHCNGRRTVFRNAVLPCPVCGGFGIRLVPVQDPSARLDCREVK